MIPKLTTVMTTFTPYSEISKDIMMDTRNLLCKEYVAGATTT